MDFVNSTGLLFQIEPYGPASIVLISESIDKAVVGPLSRPEQTSARLFEVVHSSPVLQAARRFANTHGLRYAMLRNYYIKPPV